MTRAIFRLCLTLLLVTVVLLPVTGCIKIITPDGKQATGDQTGSTTPPAQKPPGDQDSSATPPPMKPPGSQAGATTPSGQATPPTQPTPAPTPQPGAVANWTGTWQCSTWGKLYLTQTGNNVTGWYDWDNAIIT
ncbi:MAG: hypothetical protein FJZ88_10690, partial [Chloroflexi bacterium]|nr:hypothetical protein [Chloroflexota bacterium]